MAILSLYIEVAMSQTTPTSAHITTLMHSLLGESLHVASKHASALVHMRSSSRGHGVCPVSNVRVFPCALLGCAAGYSAAPFTRDSKAVTSVFHFQVHGATPLTQGSAHTTHLHTHTCAHTHTHTYICTLTYTQTHACATAVAHWSQPL